MLLHLFFVITIINAIGWLISAVFQTHKNFDLFGSCSFCITVSTSLYYSPRAFPQRIQTLLVVVWALRLGYYLFTRALERGDKRLEKYDTKPIRFLVVWTIQIFWVFLMLLPTITMNSLDTELDVNMWNYVGWGLWIVGFGIEFVADYQKHEFLSDPGNQGKFIKSGIWSISRHPNYFGEIVLWAGLFISAAGQFSTPGQYLTGLSVVFIYYLLRNVSGVNLLEKNGQKRWGMSQDYRKYVETTPILVPFVPIYK